MNAKLKRRSEDIDLLQAYSEWLEENNYMDCDWQCEEPQAIDRFLMEEY